MSNFILNILSLGTKPLYEKHLKFHKIISEFREILTSSKNQEQIKKTDIDAFYQKLNNYDFNFIFFRKYYLKYIANLNRLKPQPEEKNPDLTLFRSALKENKWKPTTPFSILIHHIKYENRFTSKAFVAFQKKQNRKKLNAPIVKAKQNGKLNSSKEWIRISIPQNYTKKPD